MTPSQKLNAIRAQFDAWQIDALWLSSPNNCRWLSGFTGSNVSLLVTVADAYLVTDFRYWQQALQQSPDFTLFRQTRRPDNRHELFAAQAANRIGIEANHLTLAAVADLEVATGDRSLIALETTVEPLRALKSDAELALIRQAAAITDAAMASVPSMVTVGMSERALAWQLEQSMRNMGADGVAFDIIVASGPNSALPHHRPSDRPLQIGDSVVIDMGAMLDGYRSDLTRTFHIGDQPSKQFWHVYNTTLAAQQSALEGARPDMTSRQVDSLARDLIEAADFGRNFGHGLGHSLGLDIHEAPFLNQGSDQPLQPGMVLTIEPGIYLPDWGGVRIEELVLVTEHGLEVISAAPKEPIIRIAPQSTQ